MRTTLPVPRSLGLATMVAFALGFLLSAAAPADAQIVRRTYTDTLEVRALNLEVVVSDRDGQRTPGLTKADFTLYVDESTIAFALWSS